MPIANPHNRSSLGHPASALTCNAADGAAIIWLVVVCAEVTGTYSSVIVSALTVRGGSAPTRPRRIGSTAGKKWPSDAAAAPA